MGLEGELLHLIEEIQDVARMQRVEENRSEPVVARDACAYIKDESPLPQPSPAPGEGLFL